MSRFLVVGFDPGSGQRVEHWTETLPEARTWVFGRPWPLTGVQILEKKDGRETCSAG